MCEILNHTKNGGAVTIRSNECISREQIKSFEELYEAMKKEKRISND